MTATFLCFTVVVPEYIPVHTFEGHTVIVGNFREIFGSLIFG